MADFDLSFNLNLQKINVTATDVQEQLDKIKNLSLANVDVAEKPLRAKIREILKPKFKVSIEIANAKTLADQFKKIFDIKNISGLKVAVQELQAEAAKSVGKTAKTSAAASKAAVDAAKKASAATGGGGPSKAGGESALKKQVTEAEQLLTLIKRIDTAAGRSTVGSKSIKGNGFFTFAREELDSFITEMKGIDPVLKKFEGTNGKSASNIRQGIIFLFNALKDLEKKSEDLKRKKILSPELAKEFDNARKRAIQFFRTVEGSNVSTLNVQFKKDIAGLTNSYNDAIYEHKKFTKEIADLNQRAFEEEARNGKNVTPLSKNLREQADNLGVSQAAGKTLDSARSRNTELRNQEKDLERVTKSAESAAKTIAKVRDVKIDTRLNSTVAASILGTPEQIERLANETIVAINGIKNAGKATGPAEIDQYINKLKGSITRLESDAKDLDSILEKVFTKDQEFTSQSLLRAKGATESLRQEIERLGKSGTPLSQIREILNKGLFDVDKIAVQEKALARFLVSIDRLKANFLGSGSAPDVAGVGKTLDALEARVTKLSNSGADDRAIRDTLTKGSIDARGLNSLNNQIENTVRKLSDLGSVQNTVFKQRIYAEAAEAFKKSATGIANSSDTIAQKLNNIKSAMVTVQAQAKIDADGGFFGSFAKLAGLATKRLVSFLFVARGMFILQDTFLSAVSSAVDLEVQFVKLEQVFSKTTGSIGQLEARTSGLKDTIFDLGQTYGVAVSEIAQSSRVLAQAGQVGSQLEASIKAIVKAQLGPTFKDINETAEASIAILNQFGLNARELETILGGINQVSSLFAVESEGIAKAVRKAGGAFSSAGGSVGEFVAAFTVLKQTTREADEALGTALRNIAIRLQRSSIQKKLKEQLGVDLVQGGKFVGFTKSIESIGAAAEKLGVIKGTPAFAKILEDIAGARQFARLEPLINDFKELEQIEKRFAEGAGSLDKDAGRALDTISNKLEQAKAAFTELSTTILQSELIKSLVTGFTFVAKAINSAVNALDGFISVGLSIAAGIGFAKAIQKGLVASFLSESGAAGGNIVESALGLRLVGKNTGGVSGGSGSPISSLTGMVNAGNPGSGLFRGKTGIDKNLIGIGDKEFIVKKSSVESLGVNTLNEINRSGKLPVANNGGYTGKIRGFAKGGLSSILKGFGFSDLSGSSGRFNAGNFSSAASSLITVFGKLAIAATLLGVVFSSTGALQEKLGVDTKALLGALAVTTTTFFAAKYAIDAFTKSIIVSTVANKFKDVGGFRGGIDKAKSGLKSLLGSGNGSSGTPRNISKDLFLGKSEDKGLFEKAFKAKRAPSNPDLFANAFPSKSNTGSLPRSIGKDLFSGAGGNIKRPASPDLFKNTFTKGIDPKIATGPLTKVMKLFGGFGPALGIFGGALIAAKVGLNFLVDSSKAAAKEALSRAKTEKEINDALNKLDNAEKLEAKIDIGSALSNFLKNTFISGIVTALSSQAKEAAGGAKSFYDKYENAFLKAVDVVIPNRGLIVSALKKVGSLFTDIDKEAAQAATQAARRGVELSNFRSGNVQKELSNKSINKGNLKSELDASVEEFLKGFRESRKAASAEGSSFEDILKNNPDLKNSGESIAKNVQDAISKGFTGKDLGLSQEFLNVAKNNGIDIQLDQIDKAQLALDKVSLIFSRINAIMDNANNSATAIEGNISLFDQRINALVNGTASFGIPQEVFDLLGKGVDPQSLGLGQFNDQLNGILAKDKTLANIVNLEFGMKSLTKNLNEEILKAGTEVRIDTKNGTDEGIINFLSNKADASGARGPVKELFNKFIEGAAKTLAEGSKAADGGDSLSLKTDALGAEFEKINKAVGDVGLKFLQRRTEIEQKYTDQLSSLLEKTIALRGELISKTNKGFDIEKTFVEFQNKISRPDKKSDLSLGQARVLDAKKQANQLRGTGLNGNASIAKILDAFKLSKQRQENFTNVGGRKGQLGVQREVGIQGQLEGALEAIAGGTNKMAASLSNFEEAAEKAAKANEFLKNTLLGTDENLINAAKGIDALNQISSKTDPAQARLFALSLGQGAKSGLSSFLGSNKAASNQFDKATGAISLERSPEANGVKAGILEQASAQKALISITQSSIEAVNNLAAQVVKAGEVEQGKFLKDSINQYATLANNISKSVENMPREIEHNHNFPDININLQGAAGLDVLEKGLKDAISEQIRDQIMQNNKILQAKNGIKI